MLTATITAKYVDRPKPGKKMWTVKDETGKMWLVPPKDAGQFTRGAVYEIGYEEHDYGSNTYRTIIAHKEIAAAGPGSAGGNPSKYSPTDLTTAERIFVCGAVNSILRAEGLQSLSMTEDQLVAIINRLRAVFARTFGGKPLTKDDVGDEIPY